MFIQWKHVSVKCSITSTPDYFHCSSINSTLMADTHSSDQNCAKPFAYTATSDMTVLFAQQNTLSPVAWKQLHAQKRGQMTDKHSRLQLHKTKMDQNSQNILMHRLKQILSVLGSQTQSRLVCCGRKTVVLVPVCVLTQNVDRQLLCISWVNWWQGPPSFCS